MGMTCTTNSVGKVSVSKRNSVATVHSFFHIRGSFVLQKRGFVFKVALFLSGKKSGTQTRVQAHFLMAYSTNVAVFCWPFSLPPQSGYRIHGKVKLELQTSPLKFTCLHAEAL
jgi:hypothetical protein